MRRVNYIFLMLLATIVLSCEEELSDEDFSTEFYYNNPPYPADADSLRILAIGNSFTQDATGYLEQMVNAASIDKGRLCLYEAFLESASFKTWSNAIANNRKTTLTRKCGSIKMKAEGSIRDLINQNWDVIIVQQVSSQSYYWSTFAYMEPLLQRIIEGRPNKNLCLGYQLVWSHTEDEMPNVLDKNIECCIRMTAKYGIDVIIPTGTAIQLARQTTLNDNMYMTRDNWHLNKGMARYIASCTWFEKLICPVFGGTILGNAAKPNGNYTDEEIRLGQECSVHAVECPYVY